MREAVKSKCYIEARKQYTDIKKLFPDYSDLTIEQDITQAISDAQAVYNQAKSAKSEKMCLSFVQKLTISVKIFPASRN